MRRKEQRCPSPIDPGSKTDVSEETPQSDGESPAGLSPRVARWLSVALIAVFVSWLALRVVSGQFWWALGGAIVTAFFLRWLWRQQRR
jgi:hypothetical protein